MSDRFLKYQLVHDVTEGWFSVEAAACWDTTLAFQTAQKVSGHLMEIGVWHGKSAALMAMHADPATETCFLVDRFLNQSAVEKTLLRVRPAVDDSLRFIRCDSRALAVAPLVAEGFRQFRWMHIDGEHTAGAVYHDLSLAHALLSQEGVVCIDDFISWMYPQIAQAVFGYLKDNPDHFTMFLCGFNKAYLARPLFVHTYLEYCQEQFVVDLEDRGLSATLSKTTMPADMNCFGVGMRTDDRRFRGPDWAQGSIRI